MDPSLYAATTTVDRRFRTLPGKRSRKEDVGDSDEGFREWRRDINRRIKALGLWPLPQSMMFEEAMRELERRDGASQKREGPDYERTMK